ncbi:sensor domain-containing protein [Methanolobus mangrovi]|uniref:Sensor domain-containing protein n=1 Tax=Methanolobus mangrovi TaxID=3072977 RepID=A0AA51YFX2_9EURY|nr:sensor domain-containing protein [Methanolobus mangrovi]WMW21317.1 sensor domain-containing protein [Methanolobus mangrovi]
MAEIETGLREFVKVAFEKQTYMNILYLLFSFPLGTAYFVFLVSGLSLGFGLLLVWIGIPVLVLVFLAWWEIASLERQLAIWLLSIDIPPMSLKPVNEKSILGRVICRVKSPVTWKALLFLLVKFPLGIFSLVVMVFLVALTLGLLINPILYIMGNSFASTFHESLLISISGIFVGLASLHVLNLLAHISGGFARKMLSNSGQQQDIYLMENTES